MSLGPTFPGTLGPVNSVPPLTPKPPGLGLRSLSLVLPGVRRISAQVEPYTEWWSDQNQTAITGSGPLLAVIGDSTAIGIGATAPDNGYIGVLRNALAERDGEPWRVINMAQSGARAADGLERQLPVIEELHSLATPPTLTICVIGTNDVVWSKETALLRRQLKELLARLPEGTLVGPVAGGSPRARSANRAVRGGASEHGHSVIELWQEPGPPPTQRIAPDRFHPNDLGHLLMARPFARHLGAPEPR